MSQAQTRTGSLAIVIALLASVLLPSRGYAISVTPTQIEMTSTGRASRGTVTVLNEDKSPLAIEVGISRTAVDSNGKAISMPADDDFLVMPPQALIGPGATQVFRVQWLGNPLLDMSESFMLYINQIPVKMLQNTKSVQLVVSMGVMINVAPPRGEPILRVVDNGIAIDGQGLRYPTIVVHNPSNVHALLSQSTIRLSGAGWSETISGGTIAQSVGIGLVQPGRRRSFTLPITLPPTVGSFQSSVELKPKH